MDTTTKKGALVALSSGALAGLGVDLSLFPLDTLKTRLQSSHGFLASGGFRNLFNGLGPVAIGSAPTAAVFFLTYESGKRHFTFIQRPSLRHMASASMGEIVGCLIRVPVEVIKQRRQVDSSTRSLDVLKRTLGREGFKGLYRGYLTTVLREIPFSLIQFPLWEWLKIKFKAKEAWQSGLCGAVAGGTSAAITTPLDVAKTRIMLAEHGSLLATKQDTLLAIKVVFRQSGLRGLFAGIGPRVAWISVGGALFLGIYDGCVNLMIQTV